MERFLFDLLFFQTSIGKIEINYKKLSYFCQLFSREYNL